ncbi:hypothetical protein T08_4549 [Trichinella sp. T8]|nr:hypothetical protein T08_4549 [Trichinella sp. T8]
MLPTILTTMTMMMVISFYALSLANHFKALRQHLFTGCLISFFAFFQEFIKIRLTLRSILVIQKKCREIKCECKIAMRGA